RDRATPRGGRRLLSGSAAGGGATPMSCPDEDTYASFLQGLLAPERVATIERHIDGCPRCTELSAEFGKLYSGDGAPGPAAAPERPAAAAPAPAVLSSGGARAGAGGGGLA